MIRIRDFASSISSVVVTADEILQVIDSLVPPIWGFFYFCNLFEEFNISQ